MNLFFNAETRTLRGGWRLLLFLTLVVLPQIVTSIYATPPSAEATVPIALGTIVFYCVALTWVLFVSWLCLRFLDRKSLDSLGILPDAGRCRQLAAGFAISLLMMTIIVSLNVSSGATIRFSTGSLRQISTQVLGALAVFAIAASFEEVLFRGYPLQTLTRSIHAGIAILVAALLFSLAHTQNPSQTPLAPVNTFLAGMWLGTAWFRTRNLWFPAGLHIGWNWTMGALYGLPVSGLHVPQESILKTENASLTWLTGGDYGPEGGVAAGIVLIAATLIIFKWNARSTPEH